MRGSPRVRSLSQAQGRVTMRPKRYRSRGGRFVKRPYKLNGETAYDYP